MSAAATMAVRPSEARRFSRQPINTPLDVIALRSGVPENLPGRCLDLSEGGVGAMVAGELSAGQHVAIELRLPDVGVPLRARARVRYQGKLRCGFEFVALPPDQQDMIHYWAHRASPHSIRLARSRFAQNQTAQSQAAPSEDAATKLSIAAQPATALSSFFSRFRPLFLVVGTLLLLAAAMAGYWRWQHSWHELETDGYAAQETPLRVPAETMEKQILSKSEPAYPEQARAAGRQGLAVLDAIIGEDGSVQQVHAISGDALLVKAAADAVRQWKFKPYQFSGRPVRVETTIAVEFQLN
jgi:TonB family protein